VAGASAVLVTGWWCMARGQKPGLLGIPEPILANGGVYSGAVAMMMAESVAEGHPPFIGRATAPLPAQAWALRGWWCR
jgi:nicotinamide mononucleotide (NMN) deamidase PncC